MSDGKDAIYAVLFSNTEQQKLIKDHCFGDCGEVSMGGALELPGYGMCFVCCQEECPYLKDQVGPVGESALTGDIVWIRVLEEK
jgi:hypothetical protein